MGVGVGVHIHHTMCGHGGEPWITGDPVDGYEPTTKTVFQFHGCHWHGCPTCEGHEKREKYPAPLARDGEIREAGYSLVVL